MQRRSVSPLLLVVLGGVGLLRGCDCSGSPGGRNAPPWSCEEKGRRPNGDDDPCARDERFVKGECQPDRCDAEIEIDDEKWTPGCCPGSICNAGGLCQVPPSRFTECENNSDCEDPGMRCFDRPRVTSDSKSCGFVPVDATGECPGGGQPFNQRCVVGLPCGGPCASGQVCNIDTNRCELAPVDPPGFDSGCAQVCSATEVLVYTDPDSMLFEQCCALSCECAPLPDLPLGAWGRYSDLVVGGGEVLVSGYDSTYGDLVMARLSSASLALDSVDYIDGLPTSGTPVANPDGPRGGLDVPGPDVGMHTSIALQDGAPRITYYDVDTQDLKYAAYDTTSMTWSVTLIDDGGTPSATNAADVGRYTSLVVDANGIAHVAYYAHRAAPSGILMTGPMYARATTQTPSSPSDWDRVVIEEVHSCEGCPFGQVCVDNGTGTPICATPSTSCPSCACDQSCVLSGGAVCRTTLPERLIDPCDGSCDSSEACVDDTAGGTECLPTATCSCLAGQVCVDNGSFPVCRYATPYPTFENYTRGVGLFISLAIDPTGTAVLVYFDSLREHLRAGMAQFDESESVGAGFVTMPLACDPGSNVGMSCSLASGPLGVAVAYQINGESLWMCQGSDFFACAQAPELVDDGVRPLVGVPGAVHLVGAYASIDMDTAGEPFIAYQDQTDNDLLLAYRQTGTWTPTVQLSDGAYGAFARLAIIGRVGYISGYLRRQNDIDTDVSHVTVHAVDLDNP